MTLTKIRILQIGDLHLPLVIGERNNLDDKDKTFSIELKSRISASPTKIVYQKLFELIQSKSFDAILFMGDLTDRGDLESFDRATRYIAQTLQLGKGRQNHDATVGIVAGNHDINRTEAKKPNLAAKFLPLNRFLASCGLPNVPVDREVELLVKREQATAKIVLLNSCWGCGAKEFIPEKFRDAVYSAIDGLLIDKTSEEFSQYYNRQLDTPAFSHDTITRVSQTRSETPEDTVEIYVAHHNLLPQRTTRLAPYTELVNAGAMRSVLTDGSKPTIYLHGHIHEDPVEIIRVPGGSNLISISAPLSSTGFNEIELVFNPTGLPLSCVISPWRFSNAGVLKKTGRNVVSILSGRRRSRDPALSRILAYILEKREVYWSELSERDPAFCDPKTDDSLQECIEMLMADETVHVDNYTMTPKNWIIRSNL